MTAAAEVFQVARQYAQIPGVRNEPSEIARSFIVLPACTRAGIFVREARESDMERICEIIVACTRDDRSCTYTQAQRREWAAHQMPEYFSQRLRIGEFLVAEDTAVYEDTWLYSDGNVEAEAERTRVVGFSHLTQSSSSIFPEGYDLEVNQLYVDPAAHRRGVGKSLMAEMEKRVVSRGCNRLCLVSTMGAVSFYEARGFRVTSNYMHQVGSAVMEARILVKDIAH